jgi:hypothetical protein
MPSNGFVFSNYCLHNAILIDMRHSSAVGFVLQISKTPPNCMKIRVSRSTTLPVAHILSN